MLLAFMDAYFTRNSYAKFRKNRTLVYNELRAVSVLQFKQSYRIRPERFNKIVSGLKIERKSDALGVKGHHGTIKIMAALRHLASGSANIDHIQTFGMGRSTMDRNCEDFCDLLIAKYGDEYLGVNWKKVIESNRNKHGIEGCIGSLDCTHLSWVACPSEFKGIYTGRSGKPTIVLECLVDASLRVNHFFLDFQATTTTSRC